MPDTDQLRAQVALADWKAAAQALAANPGDAKLKKAEAEARAAYRAASVKIFDGKLDRLASSWQERAGVVEKVSGDGPQPRTHAEKVALMKARATEIAKPEPKPAKRAPKVVTK